MHSPGLDECAQSVLDQLVELIADLLVEELARAELRDGPEGKDTNEPDEERDG